MRFLLFVTTCMTILLVFWAASVEAKDKGGGRGKGGGGGNAHAHKSSGQRSAQGGNKHNGNLTDGGQKRTVAEKPDKPKKVKEQEVEREKHPEKEGKKDKEKERKKEKARDNDAEDEDGDQGEDSDSNEDMDEGDEDSPLPVNKKEKQLLLAQKHRDKKIAQAEHLRAIAERNGNANLLANADRMEAQAQSQYAKRVAHLEKFGVTDPTLPPLDENGDPVVPPANPSFPTGTN